MSATRRLGVTLVLVFTVIGIPASATAASGHPPANVAPNPDFNQTCSQGGAVDNRDACLLATLRAIDAARAQEGVGPMALPDNYWTLPADQQLFVALNRERVDRGNPPLVGLTAELDSAAQQGADQNGDPSLTAPSYAGATWEGRTIYWGAVTQALAADYYWMYEDGWGGSADTTFNAVCTSPDASGCWGHRDAILGAFQAGHHLTMGGAMNPTAANGRPSWAALMMGTGNEPPKYTYTWNDALARMSCTPSSGSAPPPGKLTRLAGQNRDETAVLISQRDYGPGSAALVVLASDADFPDALAGGPLASASSGPLLITHPDGLAPSVQAEIRRVLPTGGTVLVLGGDRALAPAVDQQLSGDGFTPVRIAGTDRYETAVRIAVRLGSPTTVLEATGTGFADALAAGPGATAVNGAILLTNGSSQAPATLSYLNAHPGATRYAIGGPASAADPDAQVIAGPDRYGTALRVTETFVPSPTSLGFATGVGFPDALAGGTHVGVTHGGLLLVPPCGSLSSDTSSYLSSVRGSVGRGIVFGGTSAVGDDVLSQLQSALA